MSGWVWIVIIGVLWALSLFIVFAIMRGSNGDREQRMSDAWLERRRREQQRKEQG